MSRMQPLLTLVILLAACGGGEPEAAETAGDAMEMAGEAAGMAGMAAISEPIALDETEMERFVGALQALQRTGEKYEDRTDGTGDWANYGAAMAANAEAMAILREHGYTQPQQFQRVAYTIGAAMAAGEMEGREDQMAEAQKQLEAMKGQMSDEQYKAMVQSQSSAMGMISNQPEGNVELVRAWKDRIEAAVEDN